MLFHQQFDETQSDSYSRTVVSCVSHLIKRFENLAAFLLRNTRTVVAYTQGERTPFCRQMFVQNHHNAGAGIFHGIRQQVADNFSQRLLVYIILQMFFRQETLKEIPVGEMARKRSMMSSIIRLISTSWNESV